MVVAGFVVLVWWGAEGRGEEGRMRWWGVKISEMWGWVLGYDD
jgi:hypothetical protein